MANRPTSSPDIRMKISKFIRLNSCITVQNTIVKGEVEIGLKNGMICGDSCKGLEGMRRRG
jgi:hypothetical protein